MTTAEVLHTASQQWASRPDDQRFLSLADLKDSVAQRRQESWTTVNPVRNFRMVAGPDGLRVDVTDRTQNQRIELEPTHWAFSQLASFAQAPAGYLRKLPDELAAINLQYGLERMPVRDQALVLAQSNGENHLRALTSQSYGRIWDMDVVEAVERVNEDGRWHIPAASYSTSNPKRATTLYASDRDVFIFLVDDAHPITVPGEDKPLYRGFFTWNSEVGSAVFGLSTFLYRYVCDNRMIWGATDVEELRIRHTGGAPERFAYEGKQYLERYAQESDRAIVEPIVAAKAFELSKAQREEGGWGSWLQSRGFTAGVAKAAVASAIAEEGEARSLWDIINGITASARSISHTDERVQLETAAGKLMKFVS